MEQAREVHEIRVAIIGGAGFMGKAHSFAWALAAVQSDAPRRIVKQVLVELDADAASNAAAALGWLESSTDWKSVIDRHDIDIVDIVTPPHTHAEIARYAIERGKHVLSEKPLANSSEDVKTLVAAAEASSVQTHVGFNYRQNAAVQLAKQIIT
jgi:predicted dehydrogenase